MSGTTGVGIWTQIPLGLGVTVVDPGDPTAGDDRFDGDAIVVANLFGLITPTLGVTATDNFANAGAGNDQLFGNGGNDTLIGGSGSDVINGGGGFDTTSYATSSAAVVVNLTAGSGTGGDAEGDVLSSIERVIGSTFNDTLTGSAGSDTLTGGGGDDMILGAGGTNVLNGGAGNDTITGGVNNDRIVGGTGDDNLRGGDGVDVLSGNGGADILIGGNGADVLSGGEGADTFRYNAVSESGRGGTDRITDFSSADGDRISLVAFEASYAGDDGRFIGGGEASVTWREATFTSGASGVQVLVDADGNGTADLITFLQGVTSLSQSDFIL